MKGSLTAVSVVVLMLAVAAGVRVILRDHNDAGDGVSVASPRSEAGAPTTSGRPANQRLADDGEESRGNHPVEDATSAARSPKHPRDGSAPWPANIESLIWEYFAHRGKSNITSIISVECTPTDCEIVFTGSEINPRVVDTFSNLLDDMYLQPWGVRQSGMGTVELAPGARAYVISISNIPFDPSERRASPGTEEAPMPPE